MLTAEYTAILAEMERRRLAGELDAAGLLALSDLYDDAGDGDMTAFCRYVPEWPRSPEYTPWAGPRALWTWFLSGMVRREGYAHMHKGPRGLRHFIPSDVPLSGADYGLWRRYPTREAADRDLGRAIREMGLV